MRRLHEWVYPFIFLQSPAFRHAYTSVIAAPTRAIVSEHNNAFLRLLPGDFRTYLARDSAPPLTREAHDRMLGQAFTAVFLAHLESLGAVLDQSGVPDYDLRLKPGCPVFLLQDVDV